MELRIPFATLLKVALFVLACAIVIRLGTLLLLILVAALIAVVLEPLATALGRWVPRWASMACITVLLFAVVAGFVVFVVPQTLVESADLYDELPRLAERARHAWPSGAPYIDAFLREATGSGWLEQRISAVGIAGFLFALVLALYFIVDGPRLLAWFVTYAPAAQRKKILQTIEDVRFEIFAYMRGTLITSVLSLFIALAVLLPLGVPAALPLAVLAFAGNFVPVVGYIASLIPAVLLAATVSPRAALIVTAVYVAYQALENYVISPRVYGRQMEMSTVAVLLAFAAGALILGPLGAIVILPFVAAWPAVEKIWLADRLPPDTIEIHERL